MYRIEPHSADFYDSLSQTWLTRRALEELERRITQLPRRRQQASTSKDVHRRVILKKIQRFARHGGPELCSLRGYPPPWTVSHSNYFGSTQTKSTISMDKSTKKTRRASAYDNNFEQYLVDNGIYPEGYKYRDGRQTPKPMLEGLRESLAKRRPSLSPSRWPDSKFEDFQQANTRVIQESDVIREVLPIISGNSKIPNTQNLLFTRLKPIAGRMTVDAKPDFYDGADVEDMDKRVQEDLGPFVIPTQHRTAPVAPNFFLETKAPQRGADIAKRQACYDGALGARAMHELQSYKQEPTYDDNAYTITTTYQDGLLRMYTTHPTQGKDGIEYHMTQVNGWYLTGNIYTFREGVTAFRNARDWAQEQRKALISSANTRAEPMVTETSPSESSSHNDPANASPVDARCATEEEGRVGSPLGLHVATQERDL